MKLEYIIELLKKTIENKKIYLKAMQDPFRPFPIEIKKYLEINIDELEKILSDLKEVNEL